MDNVCLLFWIRRLNIKILFFLCLRLNVFTAAPRILHYTVHLYFYAHLKFFFPGCFNLINSTLGLVYFSCCEGFLSPCKWAASVSSRICWVPQLQVTLAPRRRQNASNTLKVNLEKGCASSALNPGHWGFSRVLCYLKLTLTGRESGPKNAPLSFIPSHYIPESRGKLQAELTLTAVCVSPVIVTALCVSVCLKLPRI